MTYSPMETGTAITPVYRTEHYDLYPMDTEYHIVNRRTLVKEGMSEVLPSAISKCDMWNELLEEIKERKCGASSMATS